MATKATVPEVEKEERFKVMVPRVPGQFEQEDIVLSINGKTCQIKRGYEVEITKPFFEALKRHLKARDEADALIYQLSQKT